jgi:DHA1 family tetracycline resistance protein-like MFS transporter
MAKERSSNFSFLLTIFITVFIDLLGIGIIIPVIPAVFFEEGSQFFNGQYSKDTIKVFYTLLLACYPFMQLFGAPILGALSDKYGRKPILVIALIGTFIGYLLFAYAIVTRNLWLLFFSRMLPGFTGGNISIIMSSIADVSDADSRTRNFGLVGMAFGLGFILGPMIGGLLSDDGIVSWFDHHVPFLFTAALTLLNIGLVIWRFRETLIEKLNTKISALKGLQNIFVSFTNPRLRIIFVIVLLVSIGFTFYTQFFSVLLYEEFDFKEKDIGFLYGYVGIWLALTQGLIVRYLSYRLPPKKILIFSLPLLALGISLIFIPTEWWMFYLVNPVIAIFYGITSPNMTSLVSAQADKSLQGSILGINQSMLALGQTITPLIGGYLLIKSNYLPIAASASIILLAFILFYIFRKSLLTDKKEE